jgi:anaerobic selenocysteine-containing dehydrogenase
VEKGKIKALFVWNSNPVLTLPLGNRIAEAAQEGRLFLAVHDPFVTETVKAASVAIPAPTYLEKHDVVYGYWHDYLVYNEPIRPKKGIAEPELMRALAKEYGLTHPLVEEDPWEAVKVALRGTGVTLEELREKKVVKVRRKVPSSRPTAKSVSMPKRPKDGVYLVFSSHPTSTNTQFTEVYGYPKELLTNDYEGSITLTTDFGEVTVQVRRSELVPKGVIVAYKPSLKLGLNKVVPPLKGRTGTPPINSTLVELRRP